MKNLNIALLILMLSVNNLNAQKSSVNKINLQVSNVCDHYGQIVGCNGPDSSGALPSFGNAGCVSISNYQHIDSIALSDKMNYMNIDPMQSLNNMPKLLAMGDENKILLYTSTFTGTQICDAIIAPLDTILLDSVVTCIPFNNSIYIIRSSTQTPNFLKYEAPFMTPSISLTLNLKPQMMDVGYQFAAVAGEGSSAEVRLDLVNMTTGLLTIDTVLQLNASNPKSIYASTYPYVCVASSPGDTAICISRFNYNNQTLLTTIIHDAGLNTGDWEFGYYHFQPLYDLQGNNNDKKVQRFDISNMQPYAIYNINRRLHKLINSAGDYYYFMHAVEESASNNKVIVYDYFNYQQADSFATTHPVDYIVSDFRCFVSVPEYDDRLVKMEVFPNPTTGMINIKASGLICGRDYKMDITDLSGKIVYSNIIHSKMNLEISIQDFKSGIYLLRIHTLKGVVTEKVIKE